MSTQQLYIGTEFDPSDRYIITITDEERANLDAKIKRGVKHEQKAYVRDVNGRRYHVRSANCGLDCWCALEFVGKRPSKVSA